MLEERANSAQRGPRTDGIGATPQLRTDVTASHPLGHQSKSSREVDFEEQQSAMTHPPSDVKLTPKERVKRVLDRYATLVAGIIH